MVFLYAMNTAIADERITDIQTEPRAMIRRQLQEWFVWMDCILDIHRSNFIFREPASAELEEHKTALKAAIRASHLINALNADPDFNEPELTARLQICKFASGNCRTLTKRSPQRGTRKRSNPCKFSRRNLTK